MAQRQLRSVLHHPTTWDRLLAKDTIQEYGVDPDLAEALTELHEEHRRVNILSDQPAREDALGFAPLIRTLCNIVLSRSTETPLTIAVDGQWGSGKTSVLRMIETQARMAGFSCIWLNAWSLESAENLIAVVAREVRQELAKYSTPNERVLKKLTDFIVSVVGHAALFPLAGLSSTNNLFRRITDTMMRGLGLMWTQYAIERNIKEVASVVASHQAFRDLIEFLLDEQGGTDKRVLVFIDDLDRALPDQVATILKNLKLVLESERCVFLLAMDMEIVARAIEEHYLKSKADVSLLAKMSNIRSSTINIGASGGSGAAAFGHKYLEKLIQLRIPVPQLSRASLGPFLDALSIAPEVAEIVAWAPEDETLNPRRLKRFINWLSLNLQLLNSLKGPGAVDNLVLLQLLMLRRYYPAFYNMLPRYEMKPDELLLVWMRQRSWPRSIHTEDAFRNFVAPLLRLDLEEIELFITDTSLLHLGSKVADAREAGSAPLGIDKSSDEFGDEGSPKLEPPA